MSFELADAGTDRFDRHYHGVPDWIPVPAIAHAFRKEWQAPRETYGRPPNIGDIIERCRESRRSLIDVRGRISMILSAREALDQIVDVTCDYPFWDDDLIGDDAADSKLSDDLMPR